MTLLELYWLFVFAAAVWAWRDARHLADEGHEVWGMPFAAFVLVLFFAPIALPAYIAAHSAVVRKGPVDARESELM